MNINLVKCLEVMPSGSWVGVLITEHPTGLLQTPGTPTGETKVIMIR